MVENIGLEWLSRPGVSSNHGRNAVGNWLYIKHLFIIIFINSEFFLWFIPVSILPRSYIRNIVSLEISVCKIPNHCY